MLAGDSSPAQLPTFGKRWTPTRHMGEDWGLPTPRPPVEFSPKSLDATPGEMGLSPCRSGQGPWDGAEAGGGGKEGCAVAVASDTLSGAAGRVGCDCWNMTGR